MGISEMTEDMLSDALALSIIAASQSRSYRARSFIFQEGQNCNFVYLVLSGRLHMLGSTADNRDALLRIAGCGDLLGASVALAGGCFHCSALAMSHAKVTAVPVVRFRTIAAQHALLVARALAQECISISEQACKLQISGTTSQRVARFILDEIPATCRQTWFPFHFTHEEVARLVGRTREAVTRACSELKHGGVIECRDGAMRVLCRERLEGVAGIPGENLRSLVGAA